MNPTDHDLLIRVVETVEWLKLATMGLYGLAGAAILPPVVSFFNKKKTGG